MKSIPTPILVCLILVASFLLEHAFNPVEKEAGVHAGQKSESPEAKSVQVSEEVQRIRSESMPVYNHDDEKAAAYDRAVSRWAERAESGLPPLELVNMKFQLVEMTIAKQVEVLEKYKQKIEAGTLPPDEREEAPSPEEVQEFIDRIKSEGLVIQ